MHGGQLDEDCLDSAHGLLQGMVQDSGMMPWLDHLQLSAESLTSDELGAADQEGSIPLNEVAVENSPHIRKRAFEAGPGSPSHADSQPMRQRARHCEYSAVSGGREGAARAGATTDAEAVEGMVQLLAGNSRAPAAAPRASAAEPESKARCSEPAARGSAATRGGGLIVKTEEGTTPRKHTNPKDL